MNVTAIHHGVSTTVVEVEGFAQVSWAPWQAALVSAIAKLGARDAFDVTVPDDPNFVTGLSCKFQGKDFSFISDNPGEVVIAFGTLRPRFSEQLMAEIAESWSSVAV
jgi:hypothetical protein